MIVFFLDRNRDGRVDSRVITGLGSDEQPPIRHLQSLAHADKAQAVTGQRGLKFEASA